MTVLLVIASFAFFISLDVILTRRHSVTRSHAVAPEPVPAALEPVWVAGYLLPEGLHYHRGHTWLRVLDAETVSVGLDDFARRLIGPARNVHLPSIGARVRQGAKAFALDVDGRSADLVSPVAGEVVAVNEELATRPRLATDDPYGRGWVFKVKAPRLGECMRNLLSGSLARRFTEDSREGLDLRLMALSGSVLQDGGEPVADFARHLAEPEWRRLVGEFLLT
jgi:glycine cleavage system H protein